MIYIYFLLFLGAFAKLRKPAVRVGVSVRLSARNSTPTRRIFIKFDIWVRFGKNCLVNWSLVKIWQEQRALHIKTDIHFWSYLAPFFLELKMFQTKVVEKIKTHILCSVIFFSPHNRAVYDITWKNTVQPDRPKMIIRRMPFACWIRKATNTHSEYVIGSVITVNNTTMYI